MTRIDCGKKKEMIEEGNLKDKEEFLRKDRKIQRSLSKKQKD